MKREIMLLFVISMFTNMTVMSQTYQIGHRQVTYVDPARSNRSILTEIYYPSNVAGDNVPVASGQFPIIVFGHGFVMTWDAYQWLWDSLVPRGYIMAFPRTEGNISPNHDEFGKDLKFLNEEIKSENNNPSSFLYQKIGATSAIMGHSMGGGASFLAAKNYTNFTTLVNFAAAVTNPSSITAAQYVTVPTLMFIGENDGVAPPNQHQIKMFDSCASTCKTRVTIKGGGHCYFANYNFNCSFGEATTSPQPTISRNEQFSRVMYILIPYLDYLLKGDMNAGTLYWNRLTNDTNTTHVKYCTTTDIRETSSAPFTIYPNIVSNDQLNILFSHEGYPVTIFIKNLLGETVYELTTTQKHVEILLSDKFSAGIYFVEVQYQNKTHTSKFVKR